MKEEEGRKVHEMLVQVISECKLFCLQTLQSSRLGNISSLKKRRAGGKQVLPDPSYNWWRKVQHKERVSLWLWVTICTRFPSSLVVAWDDSSLLYSFLFPSLFSVSRDEEPVMAGSETWASSLSTRLSCYQWVERNSTTILPVDCIVDAFSLFFASSSPWETTCDLEGRIRKAEPRSRPTSEERGMHIAVKGENLTSGIWRWKGEEIKAEYFSRSLVTCNKQWVQETISSQKQETFFSSYLLLLSSFLVPSASSAVIELQLLFQIFADTRSSKKSTENVFSPSN